MVAKKHNSYHVTKSPLCGEMSLYFSIYVYQEYYFSIYVYQEYMWLLYIVFLSMDSWMLEKIDVDRLYLMWEIEDHGLLPIQQVKRKKNMLKLLYQIEEAEKNKWGEKENKLKTTEMQVEQKKQQVKDKLNNWRNKSLYG